MLAETTTAQIAQTVTTAAQVGAEQVNKYAQMGLDIVKKYGPGLIFAVIILIVGTWIAKGIRKGLRKVLMRASIDKALSNFLVNIIYYVLYILILLMALGKLGVQTTSFVAILGALGFAVGFALKDSLSHFAAGVMILFFKPFTLGDYVDAGGSAGTVDEIGIFNSRFRTPDNKIVIVPNGSIIGENITNYSRETTRRIDIITGIAYGADLKKAKEVLAKLMEDEQRVLKDPAPFVGVNELADSSVNLVMKMWVQGTDYWDLFYEMRERIKLAFDENGIEIPFPNITIHTEK